MRAAAGDTQIEWRAATHSEVGSMDDTDHSELFSLSFFQMSLTPVQESVGVLFDTRRKASRSSSSASLTCGPEVQTSQHCMYA